MREFDSGRIWLVLSISGDPGKYPVPHIQKHREDVNEIGFSRAMFEERSLDNEYS